MIIKSWSLKESLTKQVPFKVKVELLFLKKLSKKHQKPQETKATEQPPVCTIYAFPPRTDPNRYYLMC